MNSNNKNTSYGVKLAAFAVAIILFAAITVYSTSSAEVMPGYVSTAAFVNPFSSDDGKTFLNSSKNEDINIPDTTSIKKGSRTLKFNEDDKRYKAKLKDGKLEELYIDGGKVDDKDLSKYENLVAKRAEEFDETMSEFRSNMKDYKEKMTG